MADVSIPISNQEDDQCNSKTRWSKIKRAIKFISMFIVWLLGNALLVFTFGWVKINDPRIQALVIEICTQVIGLNFLILLLSTFHQRIIVFVTAIHIILKRETYDEESAQNSDYDKKQQIIKKYLNWYDDKQDSLSFVLLVTVLRIINALTTFSIIGLMWGFSAYDKDGKIILRMITDKPRPTLLSSILFGVSMTSILIAFVLIGYKLYKKKKLRE